MTWRYQAIKDTSDGQTFYRVYACYYEPGEHLTNHSVFCLGPHGETLEELKDDLKTMLEDITTHPVLDMAELRERFPESEEAR